MNSVKTANRRRSHTVAGVIVLALLAMLCAGALILSKSALSSWLLALAIFCAFIAARRALLAAGLWRGWEALLGWVLLLVLLGVNLRFAEPPYRRVSPVELPARLSRIVTVQQGQIEGVQTADGAVEIYAAIPYAAPPVGENRWREPQPAEPWEGVRDCSRFAPMAMQKRDGTLYSSLTQLLGTHNFEWSPKTNYREPVSEDCLYLNVWKPADTGNEPLPVLVYIHGGSLMTGQSYYDNYRGDDFARKGVIFVTVAYRLGVFGYYANEALAAESPNGTTGNYGLLDQIAALRWVHENIAAFGGDPEKVTIAGESAGASSVNALCVSPLTEGLFRYAIAESSGIVAKHPYHTFRDYDDALEMGQKVMAEMGAADIAALRALPAEKLVQTRYQNSSMTVDGYAVTEQPWLTYERGANHETALLNGFNAKEADAFMMPQKATAENYEELLRPISGDYSAELAALIPAGSVQRDQHFIIDALGDAKGSLCHVYSAAWFTYSHHLWSKALLAQGKPVYEYYFTKRNNSLSNYHAGELPYVYGNLWRHPQLYDASDLQLSDQMQSYWVNFVKTGDPNGPGLTEWEAREEGSERLLELGENVGMTEDPYSPIYPILDKYQNSYTKK